MVMVNNREIADLMQEHYSLQQLDAIEALLTGHGAFEFHRLENGLFPAASLIETTEHTGYSHVWVRDNIFVAFAHHLRGRNEVAVENVRALARYFLKYRVRFEAIVNGTVDFNEPMNRPHIRFDGRSLDEINQKWAHAQNDALGYFLWLFCLLHNSGHYTLTPAERELLTLFVLYFDTIRYWQDEDSGHWEESRKVKASSIGVVVRGLQEFDMLLKNQSELGFIYYGKKVTAALLDQMIATGKESLCQILPAESLSSNCGEGRRYDAALLFLVFPLKVVSAQMGDQIVSDVILHLKGEHGIRRYLGDSFWCADYKKNIRPGERTIDYSDDIATRDAFLRPKEEAQWCIFDPIVSITYGEHYCKHGNQSALQRQFHYFNRALGQLTDVNSPYGGFKCPELYYMEDGCYVPNDIVPLLWTQANLWMAFRYLRNSLVLLEG